MQYFRNYFAILGNILHWKKSSRRTIKLFLLSCKNSDPPIAKKFGSWNWEANTLFGLTFRGNGTRGNVVTHIKTKQSRTCCVMVRTFYSLTPARSCLVCRDDWATLEDSKPLRPLGRWEYLSLSICPCRCESDEHSPFPWDLWKGATDQALSFSVFCLILAKTFPKRNSDCFNLVRSLSLSILKRVLSGWPIRDEFIGKFQWLRHPKGSF